MKVTMIGAGYVGLVSGACFAEFGANVVCIDKDEKKINALKHGAIPIYEPGLEELVQKNVNDGRLTFSQSYEEHIAQSDLVFIAVGTPSRRGDGYADLTYVFDAAKEIAPHLRDYTVIIDKSTVPVGTARNVYRIINETNTNADFDVASNPEFLREGAAISDFMRPDRVVIGTESEKAKELLFELYRPLNLIETPILWTDLESAELIKYASNAFLATKISFINEISMLCENIGADIHAVSRGMGLDGRIGNKFLHPGPGYGGSCFPKDTQALVRTAQEHGVASRIVEAVIEVNAAQKARMINKISSALGGDVNGKKIAVLGLTFKPETDDMRDSPALSILPKLVEKGALIHTYDPKGMNEARELLPEEIVYENGIYETTQQADAVVILTEWNVFRGMDLLKIRNSMRDNKFIDLRNVYEPDQMHNLDFDYHCVGRIKMNHE
jgi:UDPglucose 6-dehydrogenase